MDSSASAKPFLLGDLDQRFEARVQHPSVGLGAVGEINDIFPRLRPALTSARSRIRSLNATC